MPEDDSPGQTEPETDEASVVALPQAQASDPAAQGAAADGEEHVYRFSGTNDPERARAADPTLTVDPVVVSGSLCPDNVTVTADFLVEEKGDGGSIEATAYSQQTGGEYYATIDLVEHENSVSGTLTVVIPSYAEPGPWTLEVYVEVYFGDEVAELSHNEDFVIADGPSDCVKEGSLSVGEPVVSGPACPNGVSVEIPFSAESSAPIGVILLEAQSSAFPNEYHDLHYPPLFTTSFGEEGVFRFSLPPASEAGEWEVNLELRDDTGDTLATATTTFDVVRGDESCTVGVPSITVGSAKVSNTVCPSGAEISVPVHIEAPLGVAGVTVRGTANVAPYFLLEEMGFDEILSARDESLTLQLPATAQSGTWYLVVETWDLDFNGATDETSVVVAANPGCGVKLDVESVTVSNPVCPQSASVETEIVIDGALGEIFGLQLKAVDPVGVEYVSPFFDEADDYQNSAYFSREEDQVKAKIPLELPENARPGQWTLEVQANLDQIGYPERLSETATFLVEPGPGSCAYEEPPAVAIEEIEISGPVCPGSAEVTATVTAKSDRGVNSVEVVGTLGDAEFIGDQYFVEGNEVEEIFTFELSPDAYPGRYAFEVFMNHGDDQVLAGEPVFVDVERSEDCELKEPEVVVEELKVCPSEGSIVATVRVSDKQGLIGMYAFGMLWENIVINDGYSVTLGGEETHVETFVFPFYPDEKVSNIPSITFGAFNTNDVAGLAVEYVDLDSDSSCGALDPTPGPTPAPTPGSTPPPAPTATPEPIVYWEDGYSPTGFGGSVTTPSTPPKGSGTATPGAKPDPEMDRPPAKIAFTGASTAELARTGLIVFLFGLAALVLARWRRMDSRR